MSSAECLGWELEPHFPSSATLDKSLLFPVPHLIQGNSNCTPAVGLLNGFHRCICTLVHTMPPALCNKCKVIEPRKAGYILTRPEAMQVEALGGVRGGSKEHVQVVARSRGYTWTGSSSRTGISGKVKWEDTSSRTEKTGTLSEDCDGQFHRAQSRRLLWTELLLTKASGRPLEPRLTLSPQKAPQPGLAQDAGHPRLSPQPATALRLLQPTQPRPST